MRFFTQTTIAAACAIALTACGGSDSSASAKVEAAADHAAESAESMGAAAEAVTEDATAAAMEAAANAEATLQDTAADAQDATEAAVEEATDAAEAAAETVEATADEAVEAASDAAEDAAAEVTEAAADAAQAVALPAPYDTADLNVGKRTFKLCQSCHLLKEGGGNLVGPNLYGVVGQPAGSVEGFAYSKAMKESGIVWTPDQISAYLENPAKFMPGNRMSFAGVRKPADREAVIAYIMTEGGYTGE